MSVALDDIRGTCLELQTEGNGLSSTQKLLQGGGGDLNLSFKHIHNVGSRILGESLPEASLIPPQKAEQLGPVSFRGSGNEGLSLCAGLVRGKSDAASALQDQMDLLSAPMGNEAGVIFNADGCSDLDSAENGRSVVPGPCSPLFSSQMWGSAPELKGGTVALGLAARECQEGFVAGIAGTGAEPFVADDSSEKKGSAGCLVDLGEENEEDGPEMIAVGLVEMTGDDIMRLQEENRQLLAWREAVLEVREVLEDADSAADGKDSDDPVARHARWVSCPALGVLLPRLQQRLQLLLSELAAACTRERSLAGTGNQSMGVDQRSTCPFVDVEVKVDDSVGSGSISCNCPDVVEGVMEAKRKMLSEDDVERLRVAGDDAKLMESMRVESETLRIVARILRKKEQESQERITILEREVLEASLAAAKQELLVSKLRKQLSGKATANKREGKNHQPRATPSRRPPPRSQGPSSCVNGGSTRKPLRGLQEQKKQEEQKKREQKKQEQKKHHVEVEMVNARALRVGPTRDGGREGDSQSDPAEDSFPSKADDNTRRRGPDISFYESSGYSSERGPPSWCSRDGMPPHQSSLGAEPDASAGTPLLTTQQRSVRSGAPESTALGLFDGEVERAAGPRVARGNTSGARRCPRTPTTDILRRVLYDRSSTPEAKDKGGEIRGRDVMASPGDLCRRLFTEDRADHSRTVVWVPRDDSSELACDISVDSDVTC